MSIKVTYFNAKGRAEAIRWILSYAGKDFKDNRVEKEDWPKVKPTTQTGQVPEVQYGDVTMSQSLAICRFLAREFDLYGKTNKDMYFADFVVDSINDFVNEMYKVIFEKDEAKREEMRKVLREQKFPTFFKLMGETLSKRGGKHFGGDSVCYADIVFASFLDALLEKKPETAEMISKPLLDIKENIALNAGVKNYLAKRPKTEF